MYQEIHCKINVDCKTCSVCGFLPCPEIRKNHQEHNFCYSMCIFDELNLKNKSKFSIGVNYTLQIE